MSAAGESAAGAGQDHLDGRVENAAERFVPSREQDDLVAAEHWARYRLAAGLAAGARVLDAGCGVGYGSALIAASGATEVLGLDIAPDAIGEAKLTAAGNATFRQADLRSIPEEDGSFDLVVCFEVIEHLEEQEMVVDELARLLAPGGVLLISSPNRDVYLAGNPHHVRELTPEELLELVGSRFANVVLLRQQAWTASAITDDAAFESANPAEPIDKPDLVKIHGDTPGRETFTIAMASNSPLPGARPGVVLSRHSQLRDYMDAIKALEVRVAEAESTAVAAADARREALDARDLARLELEQAKLSVAELQRNLDRANAAIANITGSLSWRLTAPLRRLRGDRGL